MIRPIREEEIFGRSVPDDPIADCMAAPDIYTGFADLRVVAIAYRDISRALLAMVHVLQRERDAARAQNRKAA